MLKTLISLDADLASSSALRYACQMAKQVEMALQTIHVEEPGADGHPPGTGWVQHTWERALLQTREEEIARVIQAEMTVCPPMAKPKMILGDREDEILQELERESYDLFIEGALHTFSPAGFHRKLKSRLVQNALCPVILVKNLMRLQRVALLFDAETRPSNVVDTFLKVFNSASVPVDLLYGSFDHGGSSARNGSDPDAVLDEARRRLTDAGHAAAEGRVIRDKPDTLAEQFKIYGLVAASRHSATHKKSLLGELLHRVPSPLLLCRAG